MLTVYSKDNCPNCVQCVNYLTEKNVDFKIVKIVAEVNDSDNEVDRVDFMQAHPQVRSVPYMIDDDGTTYRDLKELRLSY